MRQPKEFNRKQEFERWKKRLSYMEVYFADAQVRHDWKTLTKFLWGDVGGALSLNIPIVVINEVFAYLKTSVASLYSKDPFITVNPMKYSEMTSAILKEQVINYRWRKLGLKHTVKQCIIEGKLIGHSWVKVGYTAETDVFQSKSADELDERIVGEKKWAVHVPYGNIYFDPEAIDPPYDCRWIEHHYLKPIDVLEAKYGIKGISPSAKFSKDVVTSNGQKTEYPREDCKKTMVHEIWDKDTGYKLVMCDGWDDFLEVVAPEEEGTIGGLKIEGLPFVMLKFNDFPNADGKDNFPMSDVSAWKDQFLEKIKFRSQMINHVKRYNRQLLSKKGNMDQTEKEKFIQAQDGAIIEVQDVAQVQPAPYPALQVDIYNIEGRLDVDRDRISGQTQFEQGGAATSKTRTLGELELQSQGTSVRKDEQVDIIEDFCEEIAKKLLQIEKQFTDVEETARICGDIPSDWLVNLAKMGKFDGTSITYNKDDIQGEEDVDIEAGSMLPLNKDNRIQTCLNIARYGAAFGLGAGSLASIELGKTLMRDMGIKSVQYAYEQDAIRMTQPKQPDAKEKLDLLQKKQSIDKSSTDTELKKQRTLSVNLANTSKALDNARKLRGDDKAEKQKKGL